ARQFLFLQYDRRDRPVRRSAGRNSKVFWKLTKMTATTQSIGPESTMREVLEIYPGAQRALFRQYHIGGCSHCGFQPEETWEQVCQRNAGLNPAEVLQRIKASHEEDVKILIEPKDLAAWLEHDRSIRLVDVRSREEFEAVHIPGTVLLTASN